MIISEIDRDWINSEWMLQQSLLIGQILVGNARTSTVLLGQILELPSP